MKLKKPRRKKCRFCNQWFDPERQFQNTCSVKCAIELAKIQRDKQRRKAHSERKKKFNASDRAYQLKLAQMEFNKFIRLRDKDQPCISCGRKTGAKMNAGHYRSVGACPALRFEELNVHIQCEHCNSYLSGNIGEYRISLIKKIGIEKVEWLEGEHEPKKYTASDAIEIKNKYRQLNKQMESEDDNG